MSNPDMLPNQKYPIGAVVFVNIDIFLMQKENYYSPEDIYVITEAKIPKSLPGHVPMSDRILYSCKNLKDNSSMPFWQHWLSPATKSKIQHHMNSLSDIMNTLEFAWNHAPEEAPPPYKGIDIAQTLDKLRQTDIPLRDYQKAAVAKILIEAAREENRITAQEHNDLLSRNLTEIYDTMTKAPV